MALLTEKDPFVGQVRAQLDRLANLGNGVFGSGPKLNASQLANLIETAFWAGLKTEEGRQTRAAITVAEKGSVSDAFVFADPPPLSEGHLAKLAPSVPYGGCILVAPEGEVLYMWGIGRTRRANPLASITLELDEPGAVRIGLGPFLTYAVFDGRTNPVYEGSQIHLRSTLSNVLGKVLPAGPMLETQAVWQEVFALLDLAALIVKRGHGGAILVVPDATGGWAEGLDPFAYRLTTPETRIRDVIRQDLGGMQQTSNLIERIGKSTLNDELRKDLVENLFSQRPRGWLAEVQSIANLADVDGALVVTRDLRLIGFGAKISASKVPPLRILRYGRSPHMLNEPSPIEAAGGMRHQSAVRFVGAYPGSAALVISQDRHLSIAYWEGALSSVVLWKNAEQWV